MRNKRPVVQALSGNPQQCRCQGSRARRPLLFEVATQYISRVANTRSARVDVGWPQLEPVSSHGSILNTRNTAKLEGGHRRAEEE